MVILGPGVRGCDRCQWAGEVGGQIDVVGISGVVQRRPEEVLLVDSTGWVAIAGIIGTALTPLFAEQLRAKNARMEQRMTLRLVVYAELLKVTARLVDNARMWASCPTAQDEETQGEELDSLISKARVVASKAVYRRLDGLMEQTHAFNRYLVLTARPHHQILEGKDIVDDQLSIQQRSTLADLAEKIAAEHEDLTAAIRDEMLE